MPILKVSKFSWFARECTLALFSEVSKLFRFIDGFSNQKLVSRFSPPMKQSSHSQVLPKSEVSKLFQTSCQIKSWYLESSLALNEEKLVKVSRSFEAERQSRFVLIQTKSQYNFNLMIIVSKFCLPQQKLVCPVCPITKSR